MSVNKRKSRENNIKLVEKDFVPHFLPTFRIPTKFFPIPIIIVVIFSGFLAYITYFGAGIQMEGGYFSEADLGVIGGILNGILFTFTAAISAFLIIFFVKRKGIDILKYFFGFTIGFISFFMTYFFGSTIIYLIFIQFPETPELVNSYYLISNMILPILTGIFSVILLYKYFTSKSINLKNLIVLYTSLLMSASLAIFMPLWTTIAILIGLSIWDMFAVLSRRGPIREMIEIASKPDKDQNFVHANPSKKFVDIMYFYQPSLKYHQQPSLNDEVIEKPVLVYDTSKIEIGIGDLIFYSMLTSCALIQSNSIIVVIFTLIAILIGIRLTIIGLKKNKILPGLPISIFLGIATMFISWFLLLIIFP